MKFKTSEEFIRYLDESRKVEKMNKLNIETLNKYFAIAEVVKQLFTNAQIEIEKPSNCIKETNISIIFQWEDFENERKRNLIKVLENVDGFSLSTLNNKNKNYERIQLILTVENIWE